MNNIDSYYDEMISWNATISNFQQLTHNNLEELLSSEYNNLTSFLYSAESNEFVDFINGKPTLFVKYKLIVTIGSSNNINDPIGFVPTIKSGNDIETDFTKCNFYSDYFRIHPLEIKYLACSDHQCQLKNIKKWCHNCFGKFNMTYNLKYVMQNNMKISEIPKNSLLIVEKISKEIDQNDLESLTKLKFFLDHDKKKIDLIQSRIDDADERMNRIIEAIKIETSYNQKKIDTLLQKRGGSMEEYLNTINEVSTKLNKINN